MSNVISKYAGALATGVVNGYGYIDDLSDRQVDILCNIINAIMNSRVSGKDALKDFTKTADRNTFDRYVDNVFKAYSDLEAAT